MEERKLRDILIEGMELKGLNIAKLAVACGIQERYIEALIDGDVKALPPVPYVRGYLMKIGEVLVIDGGELWEIYKMEHFGKKQEMEDEFPVNRFSLKPIDKKWFIAAGLIFLVLLYIGFRFNDLVGKPTLKIENPQTENLTVSYDHFLLSGKVTPQDKLSINDESVVVKEDGAWEKEILLQPGINTVDVEAERFLGQSTRKSFQIIYQVQ